MDAMSDCFYYTHLTHFVRPLSINIARARPLYGMPPNRRMKCAKCQVMFLDVSLSQYNLHTMLLLHSTTFGYRDMQSGALHCPRRLAAVGWALMAISPIETIKSF
jgi:hypothetical protein